MLLRSLFLLVLLTGCARPWEAVPLVKLHAERDLRCPAAEISVYEQWGGSFEAIGCGRHERYQTACAGVNCTVRRGTGQSIPWRDRPEPQARPNP